MAASSINDSNIIKIGLWGGNGAPNFDLGRFVSYITKVKVYTGNVVNGLEITYADIQGIIRTYIAGSLVGESQEFALESSEYINLVVGHYKAYEGQTCISNLKFKTTSGNHYGPYGPGGGKKFTFGITVGQVVGFYGQSNGHINSIGFCLNGSDSVSVTLN